MNDSIATTILDVSPLAMIVVNPDGSVLFANTSAAALLGCPVYELQGKPVNPLLSAAAGSVDDIFFDPALLKPVDGTAVTQSKISREFTITRADGHQLDIALTQQPCKVQGKVVGLLILADVTDQRRAELALYQSETRYHALLNSINEYAISIFDPEGRVVSWSKSAEKIKGYRSEDVLGKHLSIFYPPEESGSGKAEHALSVALAEGKFEEDGLRARKDGSTFWANVVITPTYNSNGGLSGFIKITRDISLSKSSDLAQGDNTSNFHGAFQDAPIGMMLVDLEWKITRVNRSICDMLGYTEAELLTKTFQEITHPEDIGTDLDLVRQMIAGDINDYRLEKRYFHKDGHVIWMLLSASLLKDQNRIPAHFIFHIQDISEYKKIQKQISEYAYQDPLTNLPNRRLLQDRLNLALTHARRYKRHMGIMFLDIDHFKAVNDTHGHAFGDELIKAVANRLSDCVRSADTVCRLGGDEFVIVISEIANQHDISVVANKILKSTSQPIVIEGIEAQVTMSVGAVIYDADSDDNVDTLMKKADQALYEMKREGRNGFRIFK
jgi:diguanylate cyclase (GGDEF)-like protein/PAS domain S-box-containing protein